MNLLKNSSLLLIYIGSSTIKLYQKFISPHKGYICAYGAITGNHSCSEHVRQHIIENGLISGIKEFFIQTKRCKAIYYQKYHSDKLKPYKFELLDPNTLDNITFVAAGACLMPTGRADGRVTMECCV